MIRFPLATQRLWTLLRVVAISNTGRHSSRNARLKLVTMGFSR